MKNFTKFEIEINLDDKSEVEEFIKKYSTIKGRLLANRLKLKGKFSSRFATALSNYAWNKITAISCREKGEITTALIYENICDRIYDKDIKPLSHL